MILFDMLISAAIAITIGVWSPHDVSEEFETGIAGEAVVSLRNSQDEGVLIFRKNDVETLIAKTDAPTSFVYLFDLNSDKLLDIIVQDYWGDGVDTFVFLRSEDRFNLAFNIQDMADSYELRDLDDNGLYEILIQNDSFYEQLLHITLSAPNVYSIDSDSFYIKKSIACFPLFKKEFSENFLIETRRMEALRKNLGGKLSKDSVSDDIKAAELIKRRDQVVTDIMSEECM